jgi:hypothetical protein
MGKPDTDLVYATFSYLSVYEYGFIMFCVVLRVLNAVFTRIGVSVKSFVILLASFPVYVKVARFVFWRCGSVFSFCSCVVGRVRILLRNMFL